ncbi:MAG: DUF499 domain-containing protein [Gammaproteobacteria bacterium]|nr:DUF499 domain-containing protein [Gammaproteobacteria bacterium]
MQVIFDVCEPRADVLGGAVESDFAADLARVVRGEATDEYADPVQFFARTYPTTGLRDLLANVCRRLSGAGGEAAAIFRLDTSYGGGKTHGLIALAHAAAGLAGVANAAEFVDPALLPAGNVRVAAFDGENADPTNGRDMGRGVLAYTPWGEIAFALAGEEGYARVRRSDEQRIAPGSETLRELFGGEPTLILLDELSVYLRKVKDIGGAADQLTAFLTSLFKAVESAPNAALVYTLAIGRDGRAVDAYSEENQFIADRVAEAESVSARKATLLNPTSADEYPLVLRRRLFEKIDDAGLEAAVSAYRDLWRAHGQGLDPRATRPETIERFRASYPFHPEVLDTLTEKTFTLSSFQRVRGMLRLLGRTVAELWRARPGDAHAIHLHHIDLGVDGIRQELVTRLGQSGFTPAIANDIAGPVGNPSLAERLDTDRHAGLPPYARYVARTAFLHTLAFNDPLKGVTPERLRYAVIGPSTDFSFVDEARKAFATDSAYLDDRPGAPMRFDAEPNLTRLIQTEERNVDAGEARAHLNDRIREIFEGRVFEAVRFPGGPFDVPDDAAEGKPRLVVLAYDGVSVGGLVQEVPELVDRIYRHRGAEGSALRRLRNSLAFVAADDARKEDMRRRARRRLALQRLKQPDRLAELAEHQQAKVRELESRSETELAISVQQCYRHVFYPSPNRLSPQGDLAYTVIDTPSSSDRPGAGQQQVVRVLRDLSKLRTAEDEPDSPTYVRDRTPLRQGQMTTAALRNEFRRDPTLPMLVGDDVFVRGIRAGVEAGEYVYTQGDLVYGQGDPPAVIAIDEQAAVLTMAFARNKGVWPRQEPQPESREPTEVDEPEPSDRMASEPREPSSTTTVHEEGVLREALAVLWEKARGVGMDAIGRLEIRVFDHGDGFRLLRVVGGIPAAAKTVRYGGGYETRDGGVLEFAFAGPVGDAEPLREFLEAQVRDCAAQTLETNFELAFEEGLQLKGDAPEKLAERLSRFATAAAYVQATAQAAEQGNS